MFLVGATGQLLTLVLTVCLPFIFFFSGPKSLELSGNTQLVEIQQKQISFELNSSTEVDFCVAFDTETTLKITFGEEAPQKIPLLQFPIRALACITNDSGNKAPPSVIS